MREDKGGVRRGLVIGSWVDIGKVVRSSYIG